MYAYPHHHCKFPEKWATIMVLLNTVVTRNIDFAQQKSGETNWAYQCNIHLKWKAKETLPDSVRVKESEIANAAAAHRLILKVNHANFEVIPKKSIWSHYGRGIDHPDSHPVIEDTDQKPDSKVTQHSHKTILQCDSSTGNWNCLHSVMFWDRAIVIKFPKNESHDSARNVTPENHLVILLC